jgi:hypothetical protein
MLVSTTLGCQAGIFGNNWNSFLLSAIRKEKAREFKQASNEACRKEMHGLQARCKRGADSALHDQSMPRLKVDWHGSTWRPDDLMS